MIAEARQGIYELGASIPNINNFYYELADDNAQLPYVVWTVITNVPDRDTAKVYEQYTVQFTIHAKYLNVVEAIEADLKELFDNKANLAIAGYNVLQSTRQFVTRVVYDGIKKVWALPMQYLIEITTP